MLKAEIAEVHEIARKEAIEAIREQTEALLEQTQEPVPAKLTEDQKKAIDAATTVKELKAALLDVLG